MLKVQNLYKKYRFKSGSTINLELGSKGFVVLFGSKESGNNTLLNIIGGFENFDSGDLLVNNTSLKSLTDENINYYQNNYVGYILEGIGLFNHLTVSENLALTLELRGLTKEEIFISVNETITRFNLQEIKNRKPDELSEQEKQRVKLASSIAKDPKMILVDGKMYIEIMDMLKELSKEKLVIVATNDDYIKQYCDRIIEFQEREIVSDKIINEINLVVNEFEDNLELKDVSLQFKNKFNFTRKWMQRNYIMTIYFIIITLLFGLVTSFAQYDVVKVSAKTMYDNEISELVFQNVKNRCIATVRSMTCVSNKYIDESQDFFTEYNYYKENYSNSKYYEVRTVWRPLLPYSSDGTPYYQAADLYSNVTIYDDVSQFESSLIYGDKITEATDVYITDYIANILVETSEEPIQMESLIGDEISINTWLYEMGNKNIPKKGPILVFKIAGIIDTDYEHYDYLKDSKDIDKIKESGYVFDVKNKYGKIITSSENMRNLDNLILVKSAITPNHFQLNGVGHLDSVVRLTTYFDTDNLVLLGNSKMPTSEDEVVIPLQFIIDVMISEGNEPPTRLDLINEQNKYLNEFINKNINIKFDLDSYGTYEKELTIVGLYTQNDMSFDDYSSDILVVSDELYKDLYYKNLVIDLGVKLGDDEKENIALFQSLNETYIHYTPYSSTIYDLDNKTSNIQETLYKLAFALILIPVVKEIITTSSQAEDRKKQVRTLQSKGINPIRFFMMRGLMAWLITSIIGYLLLSVIMIVINLVVINKYNISYFLPYQNIFSILTVIVVALIIHFGVALKEIYHIKKMN